MPWAFEALAADERAGLAGRGFTLDADWANPERELATLLLQSLQIPRRTLEPRVNHPPAPGAPPDGPSAAAGLLEQLELWGWIEIRPTARRQVEALLAEATDGAHLAEDLVRSPAVEELHATDEQLQWVLSHW